MIKYAIPGLYSHYNINIRLLELMEMKPEFFYPNIEIEAVYGVFPFSIFDGGRIFGESRSNHCTIEDIIKITDDYNKHNVSTRLVYTNSQLEPKHFTDHFGNIALEISNQNPINQVVVNNDEFADYIKTNYPNLSLISSTTKCLNKEQFLEELKKDNYHEICLDYNLNSNMNFLNDLPQEAREKCEFLCNAICAPGCPTRKQHYKLNSLFHLQYGRNYTVPYCKIRHGSLSPENRAYKNNIDYETIRDIYEPMGFSHFKLEGRTFSDVTQAIIYANYMALPEQRGQVIDHLLGFNPIGQNK